MLIKIPAKLNEEKTAQLPQDTYYVNVRSVCNLIFTAITLKYK